MDNLEIKNENAVVSTSDNTVYGIPAIALRGKVIFPNVITAVDVGRIKSLNAVHAALNSNKLIFAVSQKVVEVDEPTVNDLFEVGTVCKVGNLTKIGNDTFKLTLEGLYRAKISKSQEGGEFFVFNVDKLDTITGDATHDGREGDGLEGNVAAPARGVAVRSCDDTRRRFLRCAGREAQSLSHR